jgi:hypothetical protein
VGQDSCCSFDQPVNKNKNNKKKKNFKKKPNGPKE